MDEKKGDQISSKGDYMKFHWDLWIILGFLAQGIFSARFLVQWIVSEKKKRSTIP